MDKKYKSNGEMLFRLSTDGIQTQVFDKKYYIDHYLQFTSNTEMCSEMVAGLYNSTFSHPIYDLIDGKKFINDVKSGCIMDYDGSIAQVFVDGYTANLGLATDNLTSGGFLVDEEVWLEICDNYKVEVNWANK